MNRHRLVTVLLAGVLLVGAANLGAFAATGAPLLLGKGNTATKTTKLKTTGNGPALKITTKPTAPPFGVSSSTKVTKLNADLVDGLDGAALRNRSYVFDLKVTGATSGYAVFALPGLPPGKYHVGLSISAIITGSPTFFGCFTLTGAGSNIIAPVIGTGTNVGAAWYASASGYLDTTGATYRLACQYTGGTSADIPAYPSFPARAVFTRVDDVTAVAVTGANSGSPRPVVP